MTQKPTYEELEQRIKELEQEALERKHADEELRESNRRLQLAYDQSIVYAQHLNEEITERKRAEERLRQSEANYRLLFSAESDAIIVVDAETKDVIDANEAALSLYGYGREELLGLKAIELSAEQEKSAAHIEKVTSGQPFVVCPGPVQRLHKKKDGTIFPVEISSGFYTIRDRKMVYGIVRDITESKRAEEKLLTYHKRLRSLASELSLAEERERRRIATEVHDNLGQNLAFAKIKLGNLLESLTSADHRAAVDELSRLVDETIQDTRALISELGFPVLYELGFVASRAVAYATDQQTAWHHNRL